MKRLAASVDMLIVVLVILFALVGRGIVKIISETQQWVN